MKLIISILLLLVLFGCNLSTPRKNKIKPTIILISLDGFHPSYLEKYKVGNLNSIAKEGIRAKGMIPVFPTKTFPSHYSIVTGLYPENHGIVHNTMYDPVFKSIFKLSKREEAQNARWWQGEPIWVTAEKNGIKTAPYFFPGSEAAIGDIRPAFWQPYDGSLANSERVDQQVLKLLDLPPEDRPQFFSLYFSDLDDAGHNYSPQSDQVNSAIAHIDSTIGKLVNGLKQRAIYDQVNIIIVSDHGMARVDVGNIIIIDDHFNEENAEVIIWDEQLTSIFPKEGKEDILYEQLKSNNPEHVTIFRKSDIPNRFHYKNNHRIPAIMCLADEGWLIMSRSNFEYKQRKNKLSATATGSHGYDNQLQSMTAIFLARGPAFKKGIVVEPFENIHLYNLMAKILDINPAENDGHMELANQILKQ